MRSCVAGTFTRRVVAASLVGVGVGLFGCTHVSIDDCPSGAVLGQDVPRLRSSHFRIALDNLPAASARFLPYAVMSAYAYRDGPKCNPNGRNPVADADEAKLRGLMQKIAPGRAAWQRAPQLEPEGNCEDERGMMFNVWHSQSEGYTDVVMAFRGTSTTNDWWYGNLWWVTRYIFNDNQITRARERARTVIEYFRKEALAADRKVRFYTTGHSLGGSLAQHVLYAFPADVVQAIVFDPSAVTGFSDLPLDQQLAGCSCRDDIKPEARIMRVYESGEILSNLRIFHKLWFPPHRHIQEIRLPLIKSSNPIAGHSIAAFAGKLAEAAGDTLAFERGTQWYASGNAECTARFVRAQEASCGVKATPSDRCPQ